MQSRKVKSISEVSAIINLYRNKKLSEIKKIKVHWACKGNENHLLNTVLTPLGGYQIFYIELKKLIELAEFGEMGHKNMNPHQLFGGVIESDFRMAKILNHWSNGNHIDPPEIYITHSQKIGFSDGRHRTIVAFQLGENYIPIALHSSLVDKISTMIKLNDEPQNL